MTIKNICNNCQLIEMNTNCGRLEIVYSYEIPVLSWCGNMWHRHWDGWSLTTSRHISKAIGRTIPKKEWEQMPVEELEVPTKF